MWDVLKIYGGGGKLLSAIKSFYEKASTCVKISGETSEHGMLECKVGGECGVWEGMEGGVVWSGMREGSKGRGKEGCALQKTK